MKNKFTQTYNKLQLFIHLHSNAFRRRRRLPLIY